MEEELKQTGEIEGAADQEKEVKTVPLAALEDERKKRQALEEKVRMLEENIALYKANLSSIEPKSQPKETKAEEDLFSGLDEDDVLTVREMKNILKKQAESLEREKQALIQSLGGTISEVQMMLTYPDYKDVITKHLPNVLKEKPHLRQAIVNSSNPYMLAYELGKLDPEYTKSKKMDEIDMKSQKIIENLSKPQLGGAKGKGAADLVNHYLNLTDEQLEERIAQIKRK